MIINKIKDKLRELTNKDNIYLTKRGNTSIKESLKFVKSKNFKDIFIQDQGGWMTYPQFIEKLKLNLHYLKTNYGIIDSEFNCFEDINKLNNFVVLFNTMPAYSYLQDVNILKEKISLRDKEVFYINDIAGSIGEKEATFGDIIIGSFGKDKPINLEKGGFVATNYDLNIEEENFSHEEQEILLDKLNNLAQRIEFLKKEHNKVVEELVKIIPNVNIIHKDKEGINVVVQFDENNVLIKEEIIKYCQRSNYEYTECPRYIRITDTGISIEIKRL
jgi:hypothetical protein